MTRTAAIAYLSDLDTDGTVGIGNYTRSAAYKLANGDTTAEELRAAFPDDSHLTEALSALGDDDITWSETAY